MVRRLNLTTRFCKKGAVAKNLAFLEWGPVAPISQHGRGPWGDGRCRSPHNHAPQRPPMHTSDPKMVSLDTMWDQDPSLLCTRELAHFTRTRTRTRSHSTLARTSDSTCEPACFSARALALAPARALARHGHLHAPRTTSPLAHSPSLPRSLLPPPPPWPATNFGGGTRNLLSGKMKFARRAPPNYKKLLNMPWGVGKSQRR